MQAAEGDSEAIELEQRGLAVHHITSTRIVPSKPCGLAIIVAMRIAPMRIWAVIDGLTISRLSQQQAAT